MVLNHNVDNLKCLVRVSHLTHNPEDHDKYHNAYIFAIQSISGKILTFHIMTDYGMIRSRVPISEIFLSEPTNDIPFHFKQLWDCFSENVSVVLILYKLGLTGSIKYWGRIHKQSYTHFQFFHNF